MIKLKDARISIFINRESTTIELHDSVSSIKFAKIILTPEQLSTALSRLSHTPCEVTVMGFDKLNKTLEVEKMSFELPEGMTSYERDYNRLKTLADAALPEGWVHDNYFNSQDSFYQKDGKRFARVTIRRWVETESDQNQ